MMNMRLAACVFRRAADAEHARDAGGRGVQPHAGGGCAAAARAPTQRGERRVPHQRQHGGTSGGGRGSPGGAWSLRAQLGQTLPGSGSAAEPRTGCSAGHPRRLLAALVAALHDLRSDFAEGAATCQICCPP